MTKVFLINKGVFKAHIMIFVGGASPRGKELFGFKDQSSIAKKPFKADCQKVQQIL